MIKDYLILRTTLGVNKQGASSSCKTELNFCKQRKEPMDEEENELDIPCSGPTSCFSPPEWQVINHHFTLEEVICINQGHPKFSSMKDKFNLIRPNQSAPYIHSLILFLFSRLNGSGDMYVEEFQISH